MQDRRGARIRQLRPRDFNRQDVALAQRESFVFLFNHFFAPFPNANYASGGVLQSLGTYRDGIRPCCVELGMPSDDRQRASEVN